MHLVYVDRHRSRSRLAGILFLATARRAAPTGREGRAAFLSTKYTWRCAVLVSGSLLLLATAAPAQTDPGPRGGTAGAGGPIAGLSGSQGSYFSDSQPIFQEGAPPGHSR